MKAFGKLVAFALRIMWGRWLVRAATPLHFKAWPGTMSYLASVTLAPALYGVSVSAHMADCGHCIERGLLAAFERFALTNGPALFSHLNLF